VINPDHIRIVNSDSITAPDVLGVQVRDVHILDDDIASTTDNPQPLPLDDTSTAGPDERLVGLHRDSKDTGVVVADRHLGCVGLVVGAPAVLVDGHLAC
jgi:hypothetical protein